MNNDGNGKRYIEKASSNEKKLTKYAKEKLCDFCRHFMDDQGLGVPVSTLSDILKEKEKWMNFEVSNVVELLGKRIVDITVSITRNASS